MAPPNKVALPAVRVPRHPDRSVAAIVEVVGGGPVGRGADVRLDVSAAAAVVPVDADGGLGRIGIAIDEIPAGAGKASERAVVRAIIGLNVGAVAPGIATDPAGLGGEGGSEQHGGEGELG